MFFSTIFLFIFFRKVKIERAIKGNDNWIITYDPLTPDLVNFDTDVAPMICSFVIFLEHLDLSVTQVPS